MLKKIKNALRIDGENHDEEIQDLIEAAKADLKLSGVKKISEDDPLIIRAITLYCKTHFGYDNDSERFMQAYEALKIHLALSTEYNTENTEE